jgi:hypothetical protein
LTPVRTGYRLLNGEGDLLPGLVCDVYGNTAVLKLDGEVSFFNGEGGEEMQIALLLVCDVYGNTAVLKLDGEVRAECMC